jgi:hypothetical protein
MNGCIVKGKLLMEALKMALRQLEEQPATFVNLCDVAMLDGDDSDDEMVRTAFIFWLQFNDFCAVCCYVYVLLARNLWQTPPPRRVPEMQLQLEQQQKMALPTITLKDSEGTLLCLDA